MKLSACREINDQARDLLRQGWEATRRGAHYRLRHPVGVSLTVPSTPSDRRASLNFAADVRRAMRRIVEKGGVTT